MRAELQILLDVASYRLRRLEMANLAGALALALVLQLPLLELGVRLAFGLTLNLLVYLNNDFCDGEVDLGASGRERSKTEFLLAHRGAAVRVQLLLVAVLAIWALIHGGGLWLPLVVGGGVCWAYSAVLKRRPFVDVAAMMAWGVAMPLVGVPGDRIATVLPLLVLLGLFSGVFECVQVLRDVQTDRSREIRTTAVVLGAPATAGLARVLAAAAAVFALTAFGPLVAAPAIAAVFTPMRDRPIPAVWNRLRLLSGITFVCACYVVWRAVT
ncbi:MAG: UbiA family prenyltransferase [Nannocystaceae bacterium]|nr:UbiA family prenyltransferase [Nannocystaceae bacterium]